MSDDNGDAGFPAEGSAATPPGARDTSIDGRLETIHRILATLGTRIDALVTSTTTYRAALTDRLTEYANAVSNLSRDQAADLEGYQQANERAVGELRRSLASSDEVLERLGQRIDALLSDQEASGGDSRAVLTEVRSIVDAQETLSRTLRESLEQSSNRTVDEVREALLDVASGDVVGALWDEFRTARQSLDTLVARTDETGRDTAPDQQLDALRAEVTELTAKVRELLDQAEVVDDSVEEGETFGVLETVAGDIAALRTELSEGLVVEPSEALSGTVDQLRAELAGLDDRMRSITETIAEAVSAREAPRPDGMLTAVAADLAAMRSELVQRLDALPAELATDTGADATVAADLAALRSELVERLDALPAELATDTRPDDALAADLAALQSELVQRLDALSAELATHTGAPEAVSDADLEGELQTLRTGVEGVDRELRALRTGVEDIIGRLDEGIGLAEELMPPAGATTPELGDQFATLRDQMSTEFDALRQLLDGLASRAQPEAPPEPPPPAPEVDLAPITELLEHLRDDLAELPDRISTPPVSPTGPGRDAAEPEYAALDPDTLDLLREEIRAAGGISDDMVSALRNDLVALRRRIKLRAEGELFTEEQLEHIAEAVARKMST